MTFNSINHSAMLEWKSHKNILYVRMEIEISFGDVNKNIFEFYFK
jgi:hypothetical protein